MNNEIDATIRLPLFRTVTGTVPPIGMIKWSDTGFSGLFYAVNNASGRKRGDDGGLVVPIEGEKERLAEVRFILLSRSMIWPGPENFTVACSAARKAARPAPGSTSTFAVIRLLLIWRRRASVPMSHPTRSMVMTCRCPISD